MKSLLSIFTLFIGLIPSTSKAHGIGQVYSLPVPLEYYLIGAGLAVAFSFFVIAAFVNKTNQSDKAEKEYYVPKLSAVILVAKALGILLLTLTVLAGVVGRQNPAENFAPIFFWIYFLIGVGVLSLFLGNIWDKLNPWKVMTDWLYNDVKESPQRIMSGAVGVVFLFVLYWWELISGISFIPRILGVVLAAYTLINMLFARLYKNWYRDGEAFSVLFGFIGNLAYFRIGEDNKSFVTVRNKLKGTPSSIWMLGVASVLLAGASFDSLKESVVWFNLLRNLNLLGHLMLSETIGIILVSAVFLLSYLLVIWTMKKLLSREEKTAHLARRFVWSLIPIAFGYMLAHNFPLFVSTIPQFLSVISDPFGFGWNLFGTANLDRQVIIIGAKAVWFIEIGLIVLAHIVGVVYAHILAINIFQNSKLALKSQYPLVLLMVGYTVLTLWLLSLPLVI